MSLKIIKLLAVVMVLFCLGCATTRHINHTLRRVDKTVASYEVPHEVWIAIVGLIGTIGWAIKYSVTHHKYNVVLRSVDKVKGGIKMKDVAGFNDQLRTEQRLVSYRVQRGIARDIETMRKAT